MKSLSYLTVPVVSLALLVLGCGQIAPTTPSENEVVLPQSAGNPTGNCCPQGFVLLFVGPGYLADHNGDNLICQKAIFPPGGAITIEFNIDNNVPGDCPIDDCIPPNCEG